MDSRRSAAQVLGIFVLLGCSPLALALADEEPGNLGETMEEGLEPCLPSYFSLSDHVGVIYSHILLMTIAWVIILPAAVMISIAASRYTFVIQIVFLVVNILGVLTGMFYNARSPDLYPKNAHHRIGWIITAVISAQVVLGVLARRNSVQHALGSLDRVHEQPFMPLSHISGAVGCNDHTHFRLSDDSCRQDPADSSSTLGGNSDPNQAETSETPDDEWELPTSEKFSCIRRRGCFSSVSRAYQYLCQTITSQSLWTVVSYAYKTIDRIILPFGFVAFTTGIITFGRFFEDQAFYNGLAHWIKGGVFFWLGLFNLGRWAGSFADLGWAWNIRPNLTDRKFSQSAEFVESFLIFFYGSTNIFLEHLGNSDGKWNARDLEHLAITILFIGGGLCGMLIESTSVRKLLNGKSTLHTSSCTRVYSRQKMRELAIPPSYGTSLNPIPALVICLLGIMMSSHHQASMTSSMVHKQWGHLLMGASFARCLTYILLYIRPPTSMLPSRPPTELLASFGLIAGGIVFMASSRDTVEGMVRNDLDAMFLYTITMGLVMILMAWEVVVLALKGLALRGESPRAFRRCDSNALVH